jgi:hypothetical protein
MWRQALHLLTLVTVIVVILASSGGSMAVSPNEPEPINVSNAVTSQTSQVDTQVFTIPAGKRLVVNYVSARGLVPAGESVSSISINLPIVHFFVVATQGSDFFGKSVFTAAQSLRATIGPFPVQRDVVVRMERNASGTDASLAVTLAGELVNP